MPKTIYKILRGAGSWASIGCIIGLFGTPAYHRLAGDNKPSSQIIQLEENPAVKEYIKLKQERDRAFVHHEAEFFGICIGSGALLGAALAGRKYYKKPNH